MKLIHTIKNEHHALGPLFMNSLLGGSICDRRGATPRFVRWLPLLRVTRLLVALSLLSVPVASRANPYPYLPGSRLGAQCDPACQFNVMVGFSNPPPIGTWSIVLTDGNTTTPHSVSSIGLTLTLQSAYFGALVTGGSATPTLDLTGLDPGPATLVVTDPNAVNTSMPFTIVPCVGGSAMVVSFLGGSRIAPTAPATFYVRVLNLGPAVSATVDVDVTGIPGPADVTAASLSPQLSVINNVSSQTLHIQVGAAPVGIYQTYLFSLQATPAAVMGSTFPMTAAFTSVYPATDTKTLTVAASLDPNGKSGPPGVGASHTIFSNTPMAYQITFENDPTALAPAQKVVITDRLKTTLLAPFSFQFGPISFGTMVVNPPVGSNPFTVTVPYDVDGDPNTVQDNINVRISGSVEWNQGSPDFGKVVWTFESLDPISNLPPDPSIGFLPPNLQPPQGDGAVSFTVSQLPNLLTGAQITNQASIVFDVNAAILTPVWTNNIDNRIPTVILDRPSAHAVRITWTGGVLERVNDLQSTFGDAPVQISPWTFTPAGTNWFYRVRRQ